MTSRAALTAIAIVCAVATAGCGLGAGKATSGVVTLTVTRNFGTAPVGSVTEKSIPGSQTVMRMLERSFKVTTRYSGGFVESIDGHAGSSSRLDWFYYVNGIEASLGASGTSVNKGDRIWWDVHDWTATDSIPAVVGSFPEPFIHGIGGRRYPVTIECATDAGAACKRVTSELESIGVPVSSQAIGGGSGTDSIGVVVGTWRDVGGELLAQLIEHGPASSGVYARFAGASGSSLQLLNPAGKVVRTLGGGAGLIAATAQPSTGPFWLITGTDVAGVNAAAAALTPARLRDHFALAVQGGTDLPVPQGATS
ncbi:MAG: DUF4430 domain-containing protein [Solirubrobacteraceae bacterium]